jgi:AcrR family transcriptional regulator
VTASLPTAPDAPSPSDLELSGAVPAAILDAARALFIEGGYEAMSIAAVADAAGLSRQVVYRRFPHPRALLECLVDRDVEDLVDRLRLAAPVGRDVNSLVGASVAVFVDFVLDHRREYLLLFGRAGRAEPEVAAILGDLRTRLADLYIAIFGPAILAAGVPWPSPAQARLVAYAVMALCEGVVLAWLEDPVTVAVSREGVIDLLQAMVVRALVS